MAATLIDDGVVMRLLVAQIETINAQVVRVWSGQDANEVTTAGQVFVRLVRMKIEPEVNGARDGDAEIGTLTLLLRVTAPAEQQQASQFAAASAAAYVASGLRMATMRDAATSHEVQVERVERELTFDGSKSDDQGAEVVAEVTVTGQVKRESGSGVTDYVA